MSLADRERMRRNRNDVDEGPAPTRSIHLSKIWIVVALVVIAFIILLILRR